MGLPFSLETRAETNLFFPCSPVEGVA